MTKYILNNEGVPTPADLLEWAKWMENGNRIVARDELGALLVSTVFLGIDHNFSNCGPPVLWETMIFGIKGDEYQVRASSREQALANHAEAVSFARAALQ